MRLDFGRDVLEKSPILSLPSTWLHIVRYCLSVMFLPVSLVIAPFNFDEEGECFAYDCVKCCGACRDLNP